MTRKNGSTTYTGNDGKFARGNPGRPKGARHRTTRAVEQLLGGEAEKLTRKAVELALEGDTTALRLCLERVAPPRKDRTVEFELPEMNRAEDIATVSASILAAVSSGELSPAEGAHVMQLVETYRKTLETTELEARIKALEMQP